MQRDGRSFTVEVSADGEGMVSHAGPAGPSSLVRFPSWRNSKGKFLAPRLRTEVSFHEGAPLAFQEGPR